MLVLVGGEALIVGLSFVAGMLLVQQLQGREFGLLWGSDELFIEGGYLKILALTGIVLLISHGFDLYDSSQTGANWDHAFRLLFVLGFVALALALVLKLSPSLLPGRASAGWGGIILIFTLLGWRAAYSWM